MKREKKCCDCLIQLQSDVAQLTCIFSFFGLSGQNSWFIAEAELPCCLLRKEMIKRFFYKLENERVISWYLKGQGHEIFWL
jgi:hypothetical protein